MDKTLNGVRVAILVADGFEEVELTEPRRALDEAGAATQVVSPAQGEAQGYRHAERGAGVPVDLPLDQADARQFDALLLPGGVRNPDALRTIPKAVEFVKSFFNERKPIAAICHGPWLLIETGALRGKRVTSWPSLKTDLKNAGAYWLDQEVVVDQGLVTSRKPQDIPSFNRKMLEEFAEGRHAAAAASAKPAAQRGRH